MGYVTQKNMNLTQAEMSEKLGISEKYVSRVETGIGGISKENVHKLSGTGIVGIAVISAIFGKEDIKQAAIDLKKETRKALYD